MPNDYAVMVVSINTVPIVDARGNFIQAKRISIKVGPHGPFTKDFLPGADSVDAINQWKQLTASEVMAIDPPQ